MFVKVPDGALSSAVLARADERASDGLSVMSMEGRRASDIHARGSIYEKTRLFRSSGSSRISQSLAAGSSASPKP